MTRIFLVGSLFFILLLGGLASFYPGWIVLAIPFAVYLLAAFIFAPAKLDLAVTRHISSERVTPGQPVRVELHIINQGSSARNLFLHDPIPFGALLLSGSNRRVVTLMKDESFTWSYSFSGPRGFHSFPFMEAAASDPFGLITVRQNFSTPGRVLILPAAPRIRRVSIRTRATKVYSGIIPARQGGPGIEFFGVREYQPGDVLPAINWRVSARHQQTLFSNEFEQERVADVGIILDARRKVNQLGDNISIFEDSVLAATSLSDAFIASGNRVGLLIYGQYLDWTLPAYGKLQRERILLALSKASMGDNQAFTGIHVPRSLFPVNSQLVMISPMLDDDVQPLVNLRALGYAVIFVSPDAVRLETSHLPASESVLQASRILALRRQVTLRRLRHAGIQVVDWDISHPFEQVVESALSRPPSFIRAINAGSLR